jgi:hypothetical protein
MPSFATSANIVVSNMLIALSIVINTKLTEKTSHVFLQFMLSRTSVG